MTDREHTSDLVPWLRIQLDEDERVARNVLSFARESYDRGDFEAWVAERNVNNVEPPYHDHRLVRTERPGTVQREIVRLHDMGGMLAEHIARFASPRRVLRDVEATRRILDVAVALTETEGQDPATNLAMRQAGEGILAGLAGTFTQPAAVAPAVIRHRACRDGGA